MCFTKTLLYHRPGYSSSLESQPKDCFLFIRGIYLEYLRSTNVEMIFSTISVLNPGIHWLFWDFPGSQWLLSAGSVKTLEAWQVSKWLCWDGSLVYLHDFFTSQPIRAGPLWNFSISYMLIPGVWSSTPKIRTDVFSHRGIDTEHLSLRIASVKGCKSVKSKTWHLVSVGFFSSLFSLLFLFFLLLQSNNWIGLLICI